MSPKRATVAEALAQRDAFDAVLDARSPGEFALDHLPGAVSWPVLDDAERARVGTHYVQVSPFEARKIGAALVARNIAGLLEAHTAALPRSWRPLVYCWRGGQRSAALAHVLAQVGFAAHVLEGGYQSFRRHVVAELERLPARLALRVLCGRTGSGKSRLLAALAAAGAQVLDLEALACHRGSVLGPLPGQAQPSQKAFETRLWAALADFDPGREVFVEGESRTIGRLRVPEPLLERLRAAPVVRVELPLPARVHLLLADYAHFVQDVELFCERLVPLREHRGAAVVQGWQERARAGDLAAVVQELLELHYDPIYERSMARHFGAYAAAEPVMLADAEPGTLARTAQALALAGR